ncbi:hypothetical protein DFO62_12663 [Serratia fonticola]|nr:hypothetical protein DFO62_12663 [Serratia fonticola]
MTEYGLNARLIDSTPDYHTVMLEHVKHCPQPNR